ncbi:MAG TPA: flippase-like domain-containing protein [Archaeoglobus profundus]|nr:flippase-like domain-containing protein [Archaeoglobus profundus]
MASNKKSIALSLAISLVTILIIFKLTETNVTWQMISQVNWKYLILALFLHFLFWFFWGLRLKTLASLLNTNISLRFAVEVSIASMFLAAITPSSAGGEPLRIKMLKDQGTSLGSATAIVLAERMLDAIFFVIALFIFLIASGFAIGFGIKVGLTFTLCLAGFILFLCIMVRNQEIVNRISNLIYKIISRINRDKARDIAEKIKDELNIFRNSIIELIKNNKRILPSIFLTALIWFSEFLVPSIILIALNQDPFYLLSITSQLILVILSLLPLTPGSSGIAEAGMGYLYSNFIPHHVLGVLVALWRLVTYYSNILAGLIAIKIIKSSINKL